MIQTKITNIVSRKGIDEWEQQGDYDALTKTFVFDSFEQGQAFV
jgi:pterin-4a-carbinolamine dehydratase